MRTGQGVEYLVLTKGQSECTRRASSRASATCQEEEGERDDVVLKAAGTGPGRVMLTRYKGDGGTIQQGRVGLGRDGARIAGESRSSLHLLATPWLYILLNSANPSHHCFFLMTTQGSARCVVILPELKEYTPNGAGWPRMRHRPASLRFARECDSSSFWAMVNDAGTLLADVTPSKESLGGSSFPFDELLVVFELTEVSTFFLVGVFTAIPSSLVNFVV